MCSLLQKASTKNHQNSQNSRAVEKKTTSRSSSSYDDACCEADSRLITTFTYLDLGQEWKTIRTTRYKHTMFDAPFLLYELMFFTTGTTPKTPSQGTVYSLQNEESEKYLKKHVLVSLLFTIMLKPVKTLVHTAFPIDLWLSHRSCLA